MLAHTHTLMDWYIYYHPQVTTTPSYSLYISITIHISCIYIKIHTFVFYINKISIAMLLELEASTHKQSHQSAGL